MHAPIQLFDETSFTYTYLLRAASTNDAVLIDPVDEHAAWLTAKANGKPAPESVYGSAPGWSRCPIAAKPARDGRATP